MDVHFFVQVRLGSTRFPGKALAPLEGENTILDAIDRRIRRARCFREGRILYLTTSDTTDDELVQFLESRGWEYLRGEVDDVFSRFRRACSVRGPESFFRVCADNPFLDPTLLDQLAVAYRTEKADYTSFADPLGTPVIRTHYGIFAELICARTFMDLDPESIDEATRQHVTPVFYESPERFKLQLIPMAKHLVNDRMRLTVDTEGDLKIVREIVAQVGLDAKIEDVYQYVTRFPDMMAAMTREKAQNEKT